MQNNKEMNCKAISVVKISSEMSHSEGKKITTAVQFVYVKGSQLLS